MEAVVHKARQDITAPFLLLVLINSHIVSSDMSYMGYINSTFSELCPYTSLCTQNPLRQLRSNTTTPCCIPCSCETDCHTRGNCCPDVSPHTKSVESSVKCQAALLTNAPSILDEFDSRYKYYYIVDFCPSEYNNSETVSKCINPEFNRLQDVKDVGIVSSSERIYSNRHCAHCNNETIFSIWTPVLYNFDMLYNTSDQAIAPAKYILEFIPLKDKQAKLSQCFPDAINKCNTTGHWALDDHHLAKACAEINSYYIHETYEIKIFKNVYCFLCNKKQNINMENKCLTRNDVDPRTSTGWFPVWTVILDIGDWDRPVRTLSHTITRHNDGCKSQDELYDKYFSVCRQLHCPILHVPIGGECIFPYLTVLDLSISVVFKLVTDEDLGEIDYITVERINNKVKKAIGLKAQGCTECENIFASRHNADGSDIFLYMSFRITASCTVQRALDTFRHISKNQIHFSVQIQSKIVAFVGQFTYEFSTLSQFGDLEYDTDNTVIGIKDMPHCYLHGRVLNDKFCEYIELSIEEYNTLMNRSNSMVHSNDFRLNTNEDNNLTVYRVCIEDYIVKPTENGASVPFVECSVSQLPVLAYVSAAVVCNKLTSLS